MKNIIFLLDKSAVMGEYSSFNYLQLIFSIPLVFKKLIVFTTFIPKQKATCIWRTFTLKCVKFDIYSHPFGNSGCFQAIFEISRVGTRGGLEVGP